MFLRTSLSNTKKFFQNTINDLKSLLSHGYQRLPKTPLFNPFSCSQGRDDDDINFTQSYNELDQFYTAFTNHWDKTFEHKPKKRSKKKIIITHVSNQEKEVLNYPENFSLVSKETPYEEERKEDGRKEELVVCLSSCEGVEEKRARGCLVTEKMKELEKMDKGDVEDVLDIEEAVKYYSQLTSPAFLQIVDKLFMDMYAEIFAAPESTGNHISRPMLQPVQG